MDNFAIRRAAKNGHVAVLQCIKRDFELTGADVAEALPVRFLAADVRVAVLQCLRDDFQIQC